MSELWSNHEADHVVAASRSIGKMRTYRIRQTFLACAAAAAGLLLLAARGPAMAQNAVITVDNAFLQATRLTSGLLVAGPPEVAREMSIFGDAMFDAANAASGLTYTPKSYGIAAPGASADAAALAAGFTALQGIFGNAIWTMNTPTPSPAAQTALQTQVLNSIASTYNTALAGLGITNVASDCASPSGGLVSVCAGLTAGTAAGNANLTARGYMPGNNAHLATADGSATAILHGMSNPYTPANSYPGTYVPPTTRVAMFPEWGSVTPAGLTSATLSGLEAKTSGPPAVTSLTYANSVLRTECQGSGAVLSASVQSKCAGAGFAPATVGQVKAALFWNDPGTTEQPPGHWLEVAGTLAQSQGLDTLQSARLVSLVGAAEQDAGIAAWDLKYKNNLWRPITAINDCTNWNSNYTACSPGWTSLIATPPHPDYVAGHPAFSGAAATILKNYFGTDDLPYTSTSDQYCNGGTTWRSQTTSLVTACTVTSGRFATKGNTIYGTPGTGAGSCADMGGTPGISGTDETCTLSVGGTPTTFLYQTTNTAGGCNDLVYGGDNDTADLSLNDSPLICPITEAFTTISQGSSGSNGSEYSRVWGGIHTDFAVQDALSLGNSIGQQLASENNIPEPGTMGLLALAAAAIGAFPRRRAVVASA